MPLDRFVHIFENVYSDDLLKVILNGVGEPLLNKNLEQMVQHCAQNRIETIEVYTNATILSKERFGALAAAGLTSLVVSLDGATRSAYEDIRAGASFDIVRKNIQRCAGSSTNVRLRLHCVFCRENVDSYLELPELCDELGVQDVYLVEVIPFSENGASLGATTVASRGHMVSQEVGPVLDRIEQRCREHGISLQLRRGWWQKRCSLPFRDAYVDVTGALLPCCRVQQGSQMGSLCLNSSEEVWNGERLRLWRGKMLSGNPPDSCASMCAFEGIQRDALERLVQLKGS